MRPNTISAGTPKMPTRTIAMKPRIERLSTTRPKKPLRSPATNQRGAVREGVGVMRCGSSGCPAQVETRKRAGECMVLALPAAPPPACGGRPGGGQRPDRIADRLPPPNPPPHAREGVTRGMEGRARGGGSDAWRGRACTVPAPRSAPPPACGGRLGGGQRPDRIAGWLPPPQPSPARGEGVDPAYRHVLEPCREFD